MDLPASCRRAQRGIFVIQSPELRAGAAANRRVVERDIAAATALAARAQAFAASLDHRTAGLIARRAADAAAVLGEFAFANAHREIALATGNAVARARAATQTICEHLAKILQRSPRDFVVTTAMDLAAGRRLFELNRAPWQHTPTGARRRPGRQFPR